ncbi:MAG: dTMP kinase [Chloroflexi bacterium]|nr:dTMP kinase [Chloroflexota bacterium]
MFITFEGPEGSGKTTQTQRLNRYLGERGADVVLVREPGGTALGDRLRNLLMFGAEIRITSRAEVLLFTAARAHLIDQVIRPHLGKGGVVICDRYADSTVAYQGWGRGLDVGEIAVINRFATGGLLPDLTFLLDVSPEIGLARNQKERRAADRFELEEVDFHRRVREGYLQMARSEPGRWVVVDATLPVEQVWEIVRNTVEPRLFHIR